MKTAEFASATYQSILPTGKHFAVEAISIMPLE